MKKLLITFFVFIIICVVIIFLCDAIIQKKSAGKLYNNTDDIPYNKVGLLPGTGKFLSNGYENLFYTYRINAASELIKSGKIKYLIIRGDNSRQKYNEPEDMKQSLIRSGIDSNIIYLDYAGFRTFDSMVRLKEIFGQNSVTIISQPFHNQRAIYLGMKKGISAIGYNAKDVGKNMGFRTQLREKFARVKVFLDYIFGNKPKFLGERIVIPA